MEGRPDRRQVPGQAGGLGLIRVLRSEESSGHARRRLAASRSGEANIGSVDFCSLPESCAARAGPSTGALAPPTYRGDAGVLTGRRRGLRSAETRCGWWRAFRHRLIFQREDVQRRTRRVGRRQHGKPYSRASDVTVSTFVSATSHGYTPAMPRPFLWTCIMI